MKIPYGWLSEWVAVPWQAAELGRRLTLAGFELEALSPAAPPFSQVIVALIERAEPHPQAERLQVCRVSTGSGAPLTIVCGAANARAGLRSALALPGAQLPDGTVIRSAQLRGIESQGMLASGRELGLADTSSGILELAEDAPLGRPLREVLDLDEAVLDLNVTPNRGDAMSVLGIAREVAALAGAALTALAEPATPVTARERLAVSLDAPEGCPRFAGCIVRGVDNARPSPLWLRERLRRAGLRSISPIVDITNYVMLELGQPMHAYDLARLQGGIRVRWGRAGEQLTLLDGRAVACDPELLLISDDAGGVGLAGIMGGERTAVSSTTRDVYFESAWFAPQAILGRARRLGLVTDAGQRFERGVDPTQQERAIARALALLLPLTGGQSGGIDTLESRAQLPRRTPVTLRPERLERLLGAQLPPAQVRAALSGLQMQVAPAAQGWQVTAPPWRFDIGIEADLIEEVARIVGFEAIPERDAEVPQRFRPLPESRPAEGAFLEALAARGYQEAITYAFVDPTLQQQLFPQALALALANPIAADLAVMRVSLWPGLVRAALENQRRQQDRVRLFEHGNRFIPTAAGTVEIDTLAGIACGTRLPEQWGIGKEATVAVDFYDVKADVEALLTGTGEPEVFRFEPAEHPALHPGRSARVLRRGAAVGWLGELHPRLNKALDLTYTPVLFELDVEALAVRRSAYSEVSRFPQVRRDLAVVVEEAVTLSSLADRVTLAASSLLRELRVFDVYRGPGLELGRKSMALGLIFQDISRTLTDDDVERLMASVVADLRESLNARIRE